MEGTGAGMKLRCTAALLPIVLLLVSATFASAAGLRASGRSPWGPAGRSGHRARAMRVRSSNGTHVMAAHKASPALGAPGTIEGKTTDATTTTGIEELEVCAWPLEVEEGEEEELLGPECTLTGANGKYEISGLTPGEYVVEFATPFDSALNYVVQFYSGASSFEAANPVAVAAGATVKAINAAMVHGGRIAGKVTAAAGGSPIAGVEVCAQNTASGSESFGCGETDPGGEYLLTGLAPGSYKVGFRAAPGGGYAPQFYSGKSTYASANEVPATKEATTEGINAALVQGGRISGLVTVAATGKPLPGAFVCALNLPEEVTCTKTEPNGAYTIAGLLAGNYDVGFLAEPGFEEEFYNGVFSLNEATPVHVALGAATAGINAAMYPEAIAPRLKEQLFPTISGSIAVGSTVSCSQGSWTGTAPLTFSYQWLREHVATSGAREIVAIPGATATAYTIQSADIGEFLACEVTAANRAGSSWARSIAYRVPVPPTLPTSQTGILAPVAPGGGALGLTVIKPSIEVLGRLHAAGGSASVKLRCAVGACKGSLQLTVAVTRRHRSGAHTVTRHLTITIGSASFSLAQGATAKVSIHLTPAGRKLLANAARHPRAAKLKLTLQGAPSASKAVVVG
jgi:hypothetical protein